MSPMKKQKHLYPGNDHYAVLYGLKVASHNENILEGLGQQVGAFARASSVGRRLMNRTIRTLRSGFLKAARPPIINVVRLRIISISPSNFVPETS